MPTATTDPGVASERYQRGAPLGTVRLAKTPRRSPSACSEISTTNALGQAASADEPFPAPGLLVLILMSCCHSTVTEGGREGGRDGWTDGRTDGRRQGWGGEGGGAAAAGAGGGGGRGPSHLGRAHPIGLCRLCRAARARHSLHAPSRALVRSCRACAGVLFSHWPKWRPHSRPPLRTKRPLSRP